MVRAVRVLDTVAMAEVADFDPEASFRGNESPRGVACTDSSIAFGIFMRILLVATTLLLAALMACGCATTLDPGAADVRILRDSAAVIDCVAVGNLSPHADVPGYALPEARNLTVALGGNTLLVTDHTLGSLVSGVAYRCP